MSIYLGSESRIVIQGITGMMGRYSARDMVEYGAAVVAGVAPGRGGQEVEGVPVFNSVQEAVDATGANVSLLYAPGSSGLDAAIEAAACGIRLIVYPGDGIPRQDTLLLRNAMRDAGVTLIGPNTPGIITPGVSKAGFMPSPCYAPGRVGVVSKSGSLSYEMCQQLTRAGIGQSTVVGVGGDPIKGLTIEEVLWAFEDDPETDMLVVLGEVGGLEEYGAVRYLEGGGSKPIVAFLVGRSAPVGKTMGHAGAMIGGPRESHAAKTAALAAAGARVAPTLDSLPALVRSVQNELLTSAT